MRGGLSACFVIQYFVSFKFCNHLDGEEREREIERERERKKERERESWLLKFICLYDVL